MKEQKFNVGDYITYKSREDCGSYYYYGGEDMGGHVGRILKYRAFNEEVDCYEIDVANRNGYYAMLESEFEEYDTPKPLDLFPIY
jgi:hypothetical protein